MSSNSLTDRSINSVKWNVINSVVKIVVGFFQTILLARLLPVSAFGIYTTAVAVIAITRIVSNYGMGTAFLNRSSETADIDRAAANHFTLNLLFTTIWTVIMFAGVFTFIDPSQKDLKEVFVVLIFTDVFVQLTNTFRAILLRQVQHQRLALLNMATIFVATIISIGLALLGFTTWALLATNLVEATLGIILLVIWQPVWRPQLQWDRRVIRYFLNYGSRSLTARLLLEALDRIDDIWTVGFLGTEALGFYSRAYTVATYPRMLIANPVYLVAGGVYAELKDDRERLSETFVHINSLMVRSGFLLAGFLTLIAPEFITLALGEKWLPMLEAFRLMVIYTLFDPIKQTAANLFTVVGLPEIVVRIRTVQLVVMVFGLFLLGPTLKIEGVALAVDIMLVTGIILLFRQSKALVDYSIKNILLLPTIALFIGLAVGFSAEHLLLVFENDFVVGFVKSTIYISIYGSILFIWDRQQIGNIIALVQNKFRN